MKKEKEQYSISKKVKIITEEGEIIDSNASLNITEEKKIGRPKGYFSIYTDMFEKMQELKPKQMKMLTYCINERNQLYNRVFLQANQKTLKKLDLLKSNFMREKKKIVELGFICPTDHKGEYIVNPRFCYSKDSDSYIKVVNDWNRFSKQKINAEEFKKVINSKKNSDKLKNIDRYIQSNNFDINDLRDYIQAFDEIRNK
ncbi:MAG: hypothetical protein IJJ82_05485 [Clostridia bacterium]|nr:hypothetical protein [Clostridia bacterium]